MKCVHCGAPLDKIDEECAYCGSVTPYGERVSEERRQRKQEEERLRNMPDMPYAEMSSVIIIYILTLGFYASHWYITRSFSLNRLKNGLRFPVLAAVIYPIMCFSFMFIIPIYDEAGISDMQAKIIFVSTLMISYTMSVQMALRVKKMLRHYDNSAVSSDWLLALFGPIYLQYCINKMIREKIFAPEFLAGRNDIHEMRKLRSTRRS